MDSTNEYSTPAGVEQILIITFYKYMTSLRSFVPSLSFSADPNYQTAQIPYNSITSSPDK
jgi:muramidase (phage lysozyme)